MKTKEIYIHTICMRKHRLFCKFESCKGNKLVTVLSKYQNKLDNSRNWYQSYVSPIGAVISSSDEKKVIAFCELFNEYYDKNAGLGSMLAAFNVWLKSVKNTYFAA